MTSNADMPLRQTKCATCPFRAGSKYAYLAGHLAQSATTEASRICHSTGATGLHGETGKPDYLCRGARDVQLSMMATFGVIAAPTDEAWNEARVKCGFELTVAKDP